MISLEQQLVEAISRFEQAWASGKPVDVRQFVQDAGNPENLLRELIGIDFACRWEAGQGMPAEVQLRKFPEFQTDSELILDLIGAEMLHMPGQPDEEKYLSRFPAIAEEIRHLFHAYRQMGREPFGRWSRSARQANTTVFLDKFTPPFVSGITTPLAPGQHAVDRVELSDRYELAGFLGEGGFKTVYQAVQASTRRKVAIKQLRLGADASRFVSEGRTQARLDHQNIPPIFVLGPDPDSPATLVEKLVPGRPWSKTLKQRSLEDNLRILLEVCQALTYSHRQHGIIHRDIKPDNVMVGDEFGEVYLVDWGLALHVGEQADPDHPTPHRSQESGITGTPAYIAPEMASGRPDLSTPATDVFLLGAVLYEILTGTPPHNCGARAALYRAMAGIIDLPENRAPEKIIPTELSRIAIRALALDPEDRHADAGEFAAALQGYLRHAAAEEQCQKAQRRLEETRGELPRLIAARTPLHPIVTRLIEIADEFRQARDNLTEPANSDSSTNEQTQDRLDTSKEVLGFALCGEQTTRFELVDLALRTGDYGLAMAQLDTLGHLTATPVVRWSNDRQRVLDALQRRRRTRQGMWAASVLAATLLVLSVGLWLLKADADARAADDRAAKAEAAKDAAKAKAARQAADLQARQDRLDKQRADEARQRSVALQRALPILEKARVSRSKSFHQVEALLLARALWQGTKDLKKGDANPLADYHASYMEAKQRALVPIQTSPRRYVFGCLTFHPTRPLLICTDAPEGNIRVWRLPEGNQLHVLSGHTRPSDSTLRWATVRALACSAHYSNEVLSVGLDGSIRVWDLDVAKLLRRHPNSADQLAPPLLTVGVEDNRSKKNDPVFVTGDTKGNLVWRKWTTLAEIKTVKAAHAAHVTAVRYRPGGGQWASTGGDGAVRLWSPLGKLLFELLPVEKKGNEPSLEMFDLAYNLDGKYLAAGAANGLIYVWEVKSRKLLHSLQGHKPGLDKANWVRTLAFLDNDRLLSGGSDGAILEWNIRTGKFIRAQGNHETTPWGSRIVVGLAIRPDGKMVASAGADNSIRLWDRRTRKQIANLQGPAVSKSGDWQSCTAFAYCPAKDLLVTAGFSDDALLRSWSTRTLLPTRTYTDLPKVDGFQKSDRILTAVLAIHPAGSHFVSAEPNGQLLFWETATGKRVRTIQAHKPLARPKDPVYASVGIPSVLATTALAWSHNGEQLASVGTDGQLIVWNAQTGKSVSQWDRIDPMSEGPPPLPGMKDETRRYTQIMLNLDNVLLFDRGNQNLLSSGRDNTIRLWNIKKRQIVHRYIGHANRIEALALNPQGTLLASGCSDGMVFLWDMKRRQPLRILNVRPIMGSLPDQIHFQGIRTLLDSSYVQSQSRRVRSLAFSPDSTRLAVTLQDGTVTLVDIVAGIETHRGIGHELDASGRTWQTVFFNRLGEILTAGSDGTIRRWDLQPWTQGLRVFNDNLHARWAGISPDGSEWAVNSGFWIIRWDRRGREISRWKPPRDAAHSAAYSRPKEQKLIVGTLKGQVIILDRRTGLPTAYFQGPDGKRGPQNRAAYAMVAAQKDGPLAASSWIDGSVDIWQIDKAKWVRTLQAPGKTGGVSSLAFQPAGQHIVAAYDDGELICWNFTNGKLIFRGLGPSRATGLHFSANGEHVVQAGQGAGQGRQAIVIWDTSTGKRLHTFSGHRNSVMRRDMSAVVVHGAAYDPKHRILATSGNDNTVRIWDARTYRPLAVLSFERIRTFATDTKPPKNGPIPESALMETALLSLAFSPDGKELMVVGFEGKVRVLNIATILREARRPITEQILLDLQQSLRIRWQNQGVVPLSQNRFVMLEQ